MDHASIPKMREAVSADNNHSTLEVVIGAPDYGKEVVSPSYDPPYAYIPDDRQQYHATQTSGLQAEPVWGLDAGTNANPADERRILGLKRRTFFITAWVVSLLLAIAIGVGAGLGATMRSRNADLQGEISESDVTALTRTPVTAIDSSTPGASSPTNRDGNSKPATGSRETTDHPSISPSLQVPTNPPITITKLSTTSLATASTTPTTRKVETSPPPSPTNTPPSSPPPPKSTSSAKPPQIGGVGGRCSNQWGGDCICLDQGICVNKWKGTPYTGFEGNWPCPDNLDNIMACIVKPCLGKTAPAQCLWRETCSDVLDSGSGSGAAICPGDGDFVCCAHSW